MNGNNYDYSNQYWIPPTYAAPPSASSSVTSSRSRADANHAMNRPTLPSAISHLRQQAHESNRLAAAAAASMSSLLNSQPLIPERNMLSYSDITPQTYTTSSSQWQSAANYHCDNCEKSFYKEQQYKNHLASHIQCPQCHFSGLKSILEIHKETVHGLRNENKKPSRPDGVVPPNAPKLDTPEALKKWIEERKRNWPSEKNIAKKKQETEERIARGELVASQHLGKRKAGGIDRSSKRVNLEDNSDTQPTKKAPSNPLSSLAGYGSDSDNQNSDDDIMDPEKDAISSKDPNSVGVIALPPGERPRREKTKRLCRYFQRGKCPRGDSCHFLHERRPKTPRDTAPEQQVEIFRTRSGLLEKLLEKDIKAEKSMLLQCLRYIVQNEFFDATLK